MEDIDKIENNKFKDNTDYKHNLKDKNSYNDIINKNIRVQNLDNNDCDPTSNKLNNDEYNKEGFSSVNNTNIKNYNCNIWFSIDNIFCIICNTVTYAGYYICIPLKYCLKLPLSQFERPYSFIMIVNYFIIVTPIILLSVGLIQNSNIIFDNSIFGLSYLAIFTFLVLNYYLTFHLYDKYGIHKLNKPKYNFTSSTYLKYVFWYLFYEHKIGFFVLFCLIQLITSYPMLKYLDNINVSNDINLNIENFKLENTPVIVFFLKLAVNCNLAFIYLHACLYGILLFTILCKLNGSCIFLLLCNWLCCWSCCFEDLIDIIGSETCNNNTNFSNEIKIDKLSVKDNTKELNNQPYDEIECKSNSNNDKIQNVPSLNNKSNSTNLLVNGENLNLSNYARNNIKYRVSKTKGVYYNEGNLVIRALPFIERMLELFKFMKVYDYEKEMGCEKILKNI
jgi:hypothetical protein